MTRIGWAFAATLLTAPVAAGSPDPQDLAVPARDLARAKELVRRLASPAFATREGAADDLARMGRLARPALTAAAADPDPEVRARAARLLPAAEADELTARIDAFRADADGRYRHDVPGWAAFRAVAGGDTPIAREWFAELLADEANARLALAVGRPDGDLADRVAERRLELNLHRYAYSSRSAGAKDPTTPDLVALLFAEAHLPAGRGPAGSNPVGPLIATRLRIGLAAEGRGEVVRAVLLRWMDTRTDPTQMADAVRLAVDLNLKEACGTAVRLIGAGGTVFVRAQAVAAIGQLGSAEHLPALEVIMGVRPATPGGKPRPDDQVISRRVRAGVSESEVQMRDVALASALQITGQSPDEYGFVERYAGSTRTYNSYYFPDGKRDGAFAKWTAWRAAHPGARPAGDKGGGGSR